MLLGMERKGRTLTCFGDFKRVPEAPQHGPVQKGYMAMPLHPPLDPPLAQQSQVSCADCPTLFGQSTSIVISWSLDTNGFPLRSVT